MAMLPRLQLFETLPPVDVAVIEPERPTAASPVPPDLPRLLQQARHFIEVRQVIGINSRGRDRHPEAERYRQIAAPGAAHSEEGDQSHAAQQARERHGGNEVTDSQI